MCSFRCTLSWNVALQKRHTCCPSVASPGLPAVGGVGPGAEPGCDSCQSNRASNQPSSTKRRFVYITVVCSANVCWTRLPHLATWPGCCCCCCEFRCCCHAVAEELGCCCHCWSGRCQLCDAACDVEDAAARSGCHGSAVCCCSADHVVPSCKVTWEQ